MTLAGHAWTVMPNLRHRLRPRLAPASEAWSTELEDPRRGRIPLGGRWSRGGDGDALLVVVHGLGGGPESHYVVAAALAAARAGLDSLRLCLRGADRSGADFYHAGLTDDLEAALRSPALAAYRRIYLLGFSLGGHVSLRFGLRPTDPRLRAIASFCAPLDLAAGCAAIDAPGARLYCAYLLRGLKEIYREVARRGSVPTPWPSITTITTMRAWDRHTVVPRFGFASVDDYYASQSVGPRLAALEVPALVVAAADDPMVPRATVAPLLASPPPRVTGRWIDGGHVAFPRREDLDLGEAGGPVDQAIAWLLRR
ncbi:MAG: alpha/beta hydrolase [Nannocystaceae bacterium]